MTEPAPGLTKVDLILDILNAQESVKLDAFLQSPEIGKITAAMVKAQKAFGKLDKDRTGNYGTYATLASGLNAVRESLNENDIVIYQQSRVADDGTARLWSRLVHISGEYIGAEQTLKPTKDDPQGFGSAVTYARKYMLMALCGIAPEDDDGQEASQRPAQQARQQQDRVAETPPPPPAEPSGRDWATEIETVAGNEEHTPGKRAEELKALWAEASSFGELTAALKKAATAHGKRLAVEEEARNAGGPKADKAQTDGPPA